MRFEDEEIQNLLRIVKRDLKDSQSKDVSNDWLLPSHTTQLCRQLRRHYLLPDTVHPAIATIIGSSSRFHSITLSTITGDGKMIATAMEKKDLISDIGAPKVSPQTHSTSDMLPLFWNWNAGSVAVV